MGERSEKNVQYPVGWQVVGIMRDAVLTRIGGLGDPFDFGGRVEKVLSTEMYLIKKQRFPSLSHNGEGTGVNARTR